MKNGRENDNKRNHISNELLQKINKNKNTKYYSTHKSLNLKIFRFFHRAWHILFSLPFVLLALGVHFILLLRYICTGKKIFRKHQIYGKGGKIIYISYFNCSALQNLSLFYYVLSGRLGLTGYSLSLERKAGDSFIYDYAPGIINLWFIRSVSRTAYEGMKETDREFISKEYLRAETKPGFISYLKLVKAEFLLIIRFLIAKIFHKMQSVKLEVMLDPIYIFGTPLRNISMNSVLSEISLLIKKYHQLHNEKKKIYFVNPDCFNRSFEKKNRDYYHMLKTYKPDRWIFADGIGINIAADMLAYPKNENVNGTDLFPRLCELAARENFKLFLLGARQGVTQLVKDNMEAEYPGLHITGMQHGYFDQENDSEAIVDKINESKADILLVAFGAPAQERWLEKWFDKLHTPVVMGVGGLFDFYSGRIKRAPRWMRDIGLEWVFRLLMEPRRMFKRYVIGNPLYLLRLKKLKKAFRKLVKKKLSKIHSIEKWCVIDMDDSHLFSSRHAELIDIMPLLFHYCSNSQIPVLLDCRQDSNLKNSILLLRKAFPHLPVYDIRNAKTQNPVIVFSELLEPLPESNLKGIWFHAPRFLNQIHHFKIIPD